MPDMLPIGTLLFHRQCKKIGTIVSYSYGRAYYQVDSDNDFYWSPDDVDVINEEEALFLKLKYD
jgi:hypothetical protein